jgi:sRNA-binding regulator protein Hfq
LYLDKPVRVTFVDGTTIEGVVTRFTTYWLEIKLNNGKVVYVNKGSIKLIEPLKEEKGGSSMGGAGNVRNKPK